MRDARIVNTSWRTHGLSATPSNVRFTNIASALTADASTSAGHLPRVSSKSARSTATYGSRHEPRRTRRPRPDGSAVHAGPASWVGAPEVADANAAPARSVVSLTDLSKWLADHAHAVGPGHTSAIAPLMRGGCGTERSTQPGTRHARESAARWAQLRDRTKAGTACQAGSPARHRASGRARHRTRRLQGRVHRPGCRCHQQNTGREAIPVVRPTAACCGVGIHCKMSFSRRPYWAPTATRTAFISTRQCGEAHHDTGAG
jgi:hypothetical protein